MDFVRAFHFLPEAMISVEDVLRGEPRPWTVGETRTFKGSPIYVTDSDRTKVVRWSGYHSSPSLWDGVHEFHGPIACLVEVSTPEIDAARGKTHHQTSTIRKLLAARNAGTQLSQFALDCSDRSIALIDHLCPGSADEARRILGQGGRPWAPKIHPEEFRRSLTSDSEERFSALTQVVATLAKFVKTAPSHDLTAAAAFSADIGIHMARCTNEDPLGRAESEWQRAYFDLLFSRFF